MYKKNSTNLLLTIFLINFSFIAIFFCYKKIDFKKPSAPVPLNLNFDKNALMFKLPKNYEHYFKKSQKNTAIKINESKKFVPSIKLNSYQALAYRKTSAKKTKLLHSILSNHEQRNKFKYVMKKAEELKLPNELALIPVIESEYKNHAVSSKGAGGLWQLMPQTARLFGLSGKQRFEMAKSTKAALRYFRDLHRKYGNWELAIAAYNAGDGRVDRALSRNPKAKTVQELKLPRETRNYVLAFFQLQKALKGYNLT